MRFRVRVPADGTGPTLMRSLFPLYPDVGAICRAAYEEEARAAKEK
jgi:hypothetical protein